MVPFLDMNRMHEPLMNEFVNSFRELISRSAFVNGPEVKSFESSFANWVGVKHCIGMSSGLDAEVIGLRSLSLNKGDRVIAPAMTFIATTEAVHHAGGTIILVDVDESGLIDLDQAEKELQKGCKFLLPVHLFGQLVNPERILELMKKYKVTVLEDACQAHGARMYGIAAGSIGDASAFSFYPGKNLGALGDGGALCTSSDEIDFKARALREHGQIKKYFHDYEGYTARLDNIQAAFLSTKLKKMDEWNKNRIEAASEYIDRLKRLPNFQLQSERLDGSHVYHLFVGLTPKRDELARAFESEKIGYGFHYPNAVHQLKCYSGFDFSKKSYPNSERYAAQSISLPIFPGITTNEIEKVTSIVRRVCG